MSLILKSIIFSILLHAVLSNPPNREFSTRMKGTYTWELILDIDNSQNSGTIIREVQVTTSLFSSYNNLKKTLESSQISSSLGSSLGGTFFEIVQASVTAQVSSEIRSSYEQITDVRREFRSETIKKDTYTIGSHSRLKLYRLVFNGPGVQYQTDTISSTPQPKDDVIIDITVKQLSFLKSIDVAYTDDPISQPNDVIRMAHGDNGDINAGFKGKFVWLIPVWTVNVNEAATDIDIAIQDAENPQYDDLAKGARGAYRYIKILRRYTNNNQRISDIALWRSATAMDASERGWQYQTIDINRGRGGDFLYLVWNTKSI